MENYVFFDIEVFSNDAMVIFQDHHGELLGIWHNNFEGLRDFVKDKILVGFNNYHYDDYILTKMIKGWSPEQIKDLNDKIIRGDDHEREIDPFIKTLDCYQQIDVSRPSLKKIEGNMGVKIHESSVPFDLDRPLNDQEIEETIEYCRYDITITAKIFKLRYEKYFKPKEDLLKMYENRPKQAYRWNTTTISANVLLKKPLQKWSAIRVPEEMLELVPPEVKEMWLQENAIRPTRKIKNLTIDELGNKIIFGFGGLHGVRDGKKKFKNVKLWDVTLTTLA